MNTIAKDGTEAKIVRLVEGSPEGLQTEEIAAALDLTRHTISKYLEILKAKDRIHYRKLGRTKLWKSISSNIRVRHLTKDDVDSVLKIVSDIGRDAKESKDESALSYLRETVERHIERNEPLMSLAAELDGRLVGFVIGEIRAWEFGQREKTGWIKALGVEPGYQGKGVGKKLGEMLLSNFKASGITRVRTLVNWYAGELLSYFRTLGFNVLNMTPLETKLITESPRKNGGLGG